MKNRFGALRQLQPEGGSYSVDMDFINQDFWVTRTESGNTNFIDVPRYARDKRPLTGRLFIRRREESLPPQRMLSARPPPRAVGGAAEFPSRGFAPGLLAGPPVGCVNPSVTVPRQIRG